MLEFCNLITVGDLHKDEASIIEVLAAIKEQRLPNDLTLLNFYRELPVNFAASIESIDRGVVQMNVHEMQVASMLFQKGTFIRSSHLPHDVIAKVLRLSRKNCLAYLTQFSYVRINADKRIYVRVKVAERIDATFYNDKHLVRGRIEDLSFSGVAIKALNGSILEQNSTGTVGIRFPDVLLEMPGRLLKMQGEDIYIFSLEVDNKSEKILSQFIFQQQSQIIRELKEIC